MNIRDLATLSARIQQMGLGINVQNLGQSVIYAHQFQQQNVQEDCPGLHHDSGYRHWYVPEGFSTQERTVCESCVIKYDIYSKYTLTDLGVKQKCSCDAHLMVNEMENDMFNVSIWSQDMRTFAAARKETLPDGKSELTVKMPSGPFNILIEYNIKKYPQTRLFRARVYTDGVLIWTSPTALKSVMGSDVGTFLNIAHPLSSHVGGLAPFESSIDIMTNCRLEVEIDVFNITEPDYSTISNTDVGEFVYKNGSTLRSENIVVSFECPSNQLKHLTTSNTYVPYTKKPIVLGCQMVSVPVSEDTKYSVTGNQCLLNLKNIVRRNYREATTVADKEKYKTQMVALENINFIHTSHPPVEVSQV